MRLVAIAAVLVLAFAAAAPAVETSRVPPSKSVPAAAPVSSATPVFREGGETMADAVPIETLPFSDTASTIGHVDDYDEMCPYGGMGAPDVVYKIVASSDMMIDVDLCASLYDTKVYIFQDVQQNTVACNDDGCGYSGYQSHLDDVYLPSGHTYYLIVDGYGSAAGTYVMDVIPSGPPCTVECPPGALIEQEPWCYDGYVDDYNSGCGHDPVIFEDIAPGAPGETVTLCGTGGTFLYNGWSYRDTDWFQLTLDEPKSITACCEAEFPILFMLLYTGDCSDLQYDYVLAGPCEPACLSRTVGPGIVWLWVGVDVFNGVPCGRDYVMTIDGYTAATSVEAGSSWGTVKAMYR